MCVRVWFFARLILPLYYYYIVQCYKITIGIYNNIILIIMHGK